MHEVLWILHDSQQAAWCSKVNLSLCKLLCWLLIVCKNNCIVSVLCIIISPCYVKYIWNYILHQCDVQYLDKLCRDVVRQRRSGGAQHHDMLNNLIEVAKVRGNGWMMMTWHVSLHKKVNPDMTEEIMYKTCVQFFGDGYGSASEVHWSDVKIYNIFISSCFWGLWCGALLLGCVPGYSEPASRWNWWNIWREEWGWGAGGGWHHQHDVPGPGPQRGTEAGLLRPHPEDLHQELAGARGLLRHSQGDKDLHSNSKQQIYFILILTNKLF